MAALDTARRAGRPESPDPRGQLVKRVLVGRAKTTGKLEHTLLPKILALPVFSSDPLSSVAYATEEAMVVLIAASTASLHLVIPIAIAISLVMVIVIASYRQTVRAYPTAAGSYVVSKDNLGTFAGLVAAAALLTDYVLTVAVSVVAGVLAITSAAPSLVPYNVELSVFFVVFITLANLRGVRESGLLFAVPTYGFVISMFALIAVGLAKCVGGCPQIVVPSPLPVGTEAVGLFLILHAFSSGSTALTGIEAISNGVSAFRRPQGRNAASTLTVMGFIAISAFLAVSFLAVHMGARPSATVSVISEVARTVFPGSSPGSAGFMYYAVQGLTFAILILAANTSFQDFPRLSAILAKDSFLPHQFQNFGDRLVFSNGMVVLALISCVLIVGFAANVDRLIQLYVVGVFTAFTLSQAGMVHHWLKVGREGGKEARGWRRRMVINGVGAVATGIVTVIVVLTKFTHGAWIVIVAIPVFILGFLAVHRHYRRVGEELRRGAVSIAPGAPRNIVVLYVEDLDVATSTALSYVRSFSRDDFRAVYMAREERIDGDLSDGWSRLCPSGAELEVIPANGDPTGQFLRFVRSIPRGEHDFVTVVIPEQFSRPSLVAAVRGRTTFGLKVRLLREPGIAVTDVPVVVGRGVPRPDHPPLLPNETVALVFISAINDATVRAVNYARSLQANETRAVFFALTPGDEVEMGDQWTERRIPVTLDLVEAPFRDLGPPILEEVRSVTARPDAVAAVIIPELVVPHWHNNLLHGQRALFIKRLLLFEPCVVLTSVPTQLPEASKRIGKPKQEQEASS